MAELGFNVGQSLAEGAKGMQEFQETVAAPQALKQAFASMSAEDRQDPQKQMAALMQAGTSLMSQGKGKAGYEMLKEASALKTASQTQQLNEMKVKTEQLDYAGQLMQGAQTEDDLRGVIDSVVTDPAAKLHVESIMKNPNVTFEQKKKSLVDMSMTAKENLTNQLNASKAALDAANKESQIEKRKADEMAKERDQALAREREKRQEEAQSFKEAEKIESDKREKQKLDLLISRTGSQDLNRSEKLALEKAKVLGIESLSNKEKALLGVGDKGTAAPSSETKTGETPKTSEVANAAKNRTTNINLTTTKKDRVSTGEVETVMNQVDPKYWDKLDTAETVRKVGGTIAVAREATNISDFIAKNKVTTGFFGELQKKLDSFNPNMPASTAVNQTGFAENEAKLGKLVLDFANQYARAERGGATPMVTVAELKNAISTFGIGNQSPESASKSFKYIADHQMEKLAYDRFNGDVNALKPRMYKDSGAPSKAKSEAPAGLPSSSDIAAEIARRKAAKKD